MSKAIMQIANGYERVAAGLRALAEDGSEAPEKKAEAAPKAAKQEKAPKEETSEAVSVETVRAVMAEKSRAGKTQEVRALLKEFGADKLSAIPEEKLADLLKKTEVL